MRAQRLAAARFVVGLLILMTLVAIAAIVGLVATGQGSARLVVVDAAGNVSTIDADGGTTVSHAVEGAAFQFPAWSPDGSRIAALGQAGTGFGVYVFDAGRGLVDPPAPTVIYESADRPPFYLYWTPDSRRVTFLTTEPTGLALRVAPADASAPDAILRQGAPMYWAALGPDRIELHAGGGPDGFLGEIALDGAMVANEIASPGLFRAPAVSRDGAYRAYVDATGAAPESPGRLVVEGLAGADRREIPIFDIPAFSFAPDGHGLAFVAADEPLDAPLALPVGPLRVLDPGAAAPRTLLDATVVGFFWSPDGRTIASLSVRGPGGIQARAAGRGAAGGLAAGQLAATPEGFALDLVFTDVATGTRRSGREVRISALFATQVLPYFDQYALSHRLWSPDSTAIALPLSDERSIGLYVIPADGSEPARVAKAEMGFWRP